MSGDIYEDGDLTGAWSQEADAHWAAEQAIKLAIGHVAFGQKNDGTYDWTVSAQVAGALKFLKEARRQVAEVQS